MLLLLLFDNETYHCFENIDFLQESSLLLPLQEALLNYLDSPFSPSLSMGAESHLAKGSYLTFW
jgi:hypothetical protein